MKAPEKIWINPSMDLPKLNGVIDKESVQYVRKDTLVAEIESLRRASFTNFDEGVNATVQTLLETLDTLEVKEVDLEKEIEEVKHNYKVDDNRHTSICSADIEWLAKHFFELGLNKDGYEQGYTDAIEKACEWLNENPPIRFDDIQNYVKNFYKAMEGGE